MTVKVWREVSSDKNKSHGVRHILRPLLNRNMIDNVLQLNTIQCTIALFLNIAGAVRMQIYVTVANKLA